MIYLKIYKYSFFDLNWLPVIHASFRWKTCCTWLTGLATLTHSVCFCERSYCYSCWPIYCCNSVSCYVFCWTANKVRFQNGGKFWTGMVLNCAQVKHCFVFTVQAKGQDLMQYQFTIDIDFCYLETYLFIYFFKYKTNSILAKLVGFSFPEVIHASQRLTFWPLCHRWRIEWSM